MSSAIAHYYDQNTSRFLRFGRSGQAAAIHRAIWGPGVRTRADAFLYLNRIVAASLITHPSATLRAGHATRNTLLDLGCGVGGTATWLAQTQSISVTGVTLSPVQAQMATARARQLGLDAHCRFLQADFHHLPIELGIFAGAYAIEAFAHAADPQRFFAQAAVHLNTGGRLFIADDFLALQAEQDINSAGWVRRVRGDWHLVNLERAADAVTLAEQAGFQLVSDQNLSAYVRTWPSPWLELAGALIRLPYRSPAWQNLSGGVSLQHCYRHGWTEYHALVFQKI